MWHVALGSRHWVRQVAAPCNVAGDSGMTCHWIRPNVCHIGILLLVSISAISPQSTCHSAPILRNFIQIGPPSADKNDVMSLLRWRISAILDFRGPMIGSLKSPCRTSYRSSIETMALNFLVYEKIAFLYFGERQTNKQTDEQMDSIDALSRSRCRERRLNKLAIIVFSSCIYCIIHCQLSDTLAV